MEHKSKAIAALTDLLVTLDGRPDEKDFTAKEGKILYDIGREIQKIGFEIVMSKMGVNR